MRPTPGMIVACYAVGLAAISVVAVLSVAADRRLRHFTYLPMQWGLNGKPTWSLPRRFALAFIPGLGSVILLALALKTAATPAGVSTILIAAALMILADVLHLAIVCRSLRA